MSEAITTSPSDGNPTTGIIATLRKPKVFGMAIFDWVLTLIAAILLSRFVFGDYGLLKVLALFILLVILAIAVHHILGINTPLSRYLGLAARSD